MRRALVRLVVIGMLCGAAVGRAAEHKVEPAQLTTYVKPVVPAEATEAHLVSFTGTLGSDGKLHDLAAVEAGDTLATAAQDAATQWVYVPFKRDGQAVAMPVYVMVRVGGAEHEASPKEPVLLSTRVVQRLMLKPTIAQAPFVGAHGMVPVQMTLGRDGTVTRAQGMAGPDNFRETAARAVKASSYRVVLFDGVPVEVGTTVPMQVGQ